MIRNVLLLASILTLSICASSCTFTVWQVALAPHGALIRHEEQSIKHAWTEGPGRLGVETNADEDGHAIRGVLLFDEDESAPHPITVLETARWVRPALSLRIIDQQPEAGAGKLVLSGILPAPTREWTRPPGAFVVEQAPWRALGELIYARSDQHNRPRGFRFGGILLDGKPVERAQDLLDEIESANSPPNFDLLRRTEFWIEVDYELVSTAHSIRGEALWMLRHAECTWKDSNLHWKHESSGRLVQGARPNSGSKRIPIAPGYRADVYWNEPRSRVLPVICATVLTPITVAYDCALVTVGGTLLLVFLALGDIPSGGN